MTKNIFFMNQDLLEAPFRKGTLFLVSLTCMSQETLKGLLSRFSECRKNTIVLTTSAPLNHLDYKLKKTLVVSFSWGKGHVYIQQKMR